MFSDKFENNFKGKCLALVSIIHEIAIVDAEVETSARHVDTVPIVREGAELELSGNNEFDFRLVDDDLLHLLEGDVPTIEALNDGRIRSCELDVASRRSRIDGKGLSVEDVKAVEISQLVGSVDGQGELDVEVVVIVVPTIECQGQLFAVGDDVEWTVSRACVGKSLLVDVGSEGVVAHFGIDGQPGIVGVVDVLRSLEVGFRAGA